MNVAYFSNQFAADGGHGIARFSRSLFSAIRTQKKDVNLFPCATWSNLPQPDRENLIAETGLETMPWGRKLTPLAWTFANGPPIERWLSNSVDLVHLVSLHFPVATKKPLVITVHDIGPLTHPEFFSKSPPWLLRKSVKYLVRHADIVICVSQATADELQNYVAKTYRQDISNRIHVVYEGVEERLFCQADDDCLDSIKGLPEQPFLLTVGTRSPRKNLQGIIHALEKLGDKIPHHLVAVGGQGWATPQVEEALRNPAIRERVHRLGYVSDTQLRALYQRAAAYLHPSLFEGFGLTVLEAMAAGCPVITSNVFSLPEVAGDAAILVDPSSTDEIAEAIEAFCNSPALAGQMIQKGIQRARLFTWEKCATDVCRLYRKVV